jgi:hypothetical protein
VLELYLGRLEPYEFSPLMLFGTKTWGDICVTLGLEDNQRVRDRVRSETSRMFTKIIKKLENDQL